MNTYYDLLGISFDASDTAIQQAYNSRIANLYQDFANNLITAEEYNRLYSACTEAKNILTNPDSRARYDAMIGHTENPDDFFRRQAAATGAAFSGDNRGHNDDLGAGYADDDYDDDYEPEEEEEEENNHKRGRRWLKIALITGASAAVIAAAIWLGPKIYRTINLKTDGSSTPGVVQVDPGTVTPGDATVSGGNAGAVSGGDAGETEYGSKDIVDPSQAPSATPGAATPGAVSGGDAPTATPGVATPGAAQPTGTPAAQPEIKNYGDIKDESLVNERATILVDEMNAANMLNMTTGLPYTVEEIQTLILYVNGEYVPATEEEASDLYTEYLNFICAAINIDDTLIQSAYLGGEESFKGTVEGFIANPHKPDIVTAFTYGDSYAAPYLYWLQNKYYEMRYTTDREQATKIFNEVFQSYADVMKGDGFVLDGVTYNETNMLGLDKVAVSNMYIYFGLNAEIFRTTNTQDNYNVTNHLISANPEEQVDTVSYDEIGAWLNGACDVSLIALDDEGRPLITSGEEGKSLGELSQINTIYRAKENYMNKNSQTLSK